MGSLRRLSVGVAALLLTVTSCADRGAGGAAGMSGPNAGTQESPGTAGTDHTEELRLSGTPESEISVDAAGPTLLSPDAPDERSAVPGPSFGDDGTRGDPVSVIPDEVSVIVTQAAFGGGEPIVGVLANGLPVEIVVEDLHTDCSIATLERSVSAAADDWEPVADCGAERLPAVRTVGVGYGRTIRIDPSSMSAGGTALTPGTYRLSVSWRPAGTVDGQPTTSISNSFAIE